MKKLLFLFFIVFLTEAGCKKETNLSGFIVGKWYSQEFEFFDSQTGSIQSGYFTITVSPVSIVASQIISAGAQTTTSPAVGYQINKKTDQIFFDRAILDPRVGTYVYNVLWDDGKEIMSWSPGDGTSTTSFLWTRE